MLSIKGSLITGFLFLLATPLLAQTKKLDRKQFYEAMRLEQKDLVAAELKTLQQSSNEVKGAFVGALLMKQAGLGANPAKKLSQFKKGHTALEAAIKTEPDNAEYRFLRLMIQEHAPGILGYNTNMQADSEYIKKSFKTLPGDVQAAIAEYDKKSKILKLGVS